MMTRLISPDGTQGAIPDLVAKLRATGARVIYTGYLRTPGVLSPVESCGPLGDQMDRRLTLMAARDPGIHFVLLSDLVTQDGDRSFHGVDMVHPSVKGSRAIAARIAALVGK
jgi:acyl-CoA thioesterase-1